MNKPSIPKSLFLTALSLMILFTFSCKGEKAVDGVSEATRSGYWPNMARLADHYREIGEVTGVTDLDTAILIDGNDNKLFLVHAPEGELKILKTYDISASKYGYGAERGSNKTPWGVHRIAGKYGAGQPLGMSFYDRRPTGQIATIYTDTTNVEVDPVTSRIIWLNGLEDVNSTSYWRFVYIHGTHEEGLLGTPQSKGCIRMGNREVIDLFERVSTGTYVNIIRPEPDILREKE
ncbi:MAG: L,D-transpeptidase [Candidatus Marinimicrobia bacterium]|nr:L,D-transpeptidase [Candidatus Neomarinimicrobiota bacterium]